MIDVDPVFVRWDRPYKSAEDHVFGWAHLKDVIKAMVTGEVFQVFVPGERPDEVYVLQNNGVGDNEVAWYAVGPLRPHDVDFATAEDKFECDVVDATDLVEGVLRYFQEIGVIKNEY